MEKILAEILRRERKRKNISQEQLAVYSGIDRSYYSKIERGENRPTLNMLIKITSSLGIKLSDVIREIEEKSPNSKISFKHLR